MIRKIDLSRTTIWREIICVAPKIVLGISSSKEIHPRVLLNTYYRYLGSKPRLVGESTRRLVVRRRSWEDAGHQESSAPPPLHCSLFYQSSTSLLAGRSNHEVLCHHFVSCLVGPSHRLCTEGFGCPPCFLHIDLSLWS